MDKFQYKCIKAAYDEVSSLEQDGYTLIKRSPVNTGRWWIRYLKHSNGNTALVEMSPNRDEMTVRINGILKKCLKFDV